jgi:hypothetical protein
MFKFSMPIARKLPLALLGSALLVSLGVGTASYLIGSQALRSAAETNQLILAGERAAASTFRGTPEVAGTTTAEVARTARLPRTVGPVFHPLSDASAVAPRLWSRTSGTNPPNGAGTRPPHRPRSKE